MRRASLLVILLVASIAHAEKRPRIAILEVTIEGDAPPELRAQIGKSLDGGLYAAGWDVVGRDEVATKLRNARALVGCASTTCLAKIGTMVGAKRFVRVRAEASGAAYTIDLELLAADAPGGLVDRLERSCPVCTLREVNDLVSKAAVELVTGRPADREPARVSIESRPPGASVSVDGIALGEAPVEADLEPGEHLFRATVPQGFLPGETRRKLAPGERAEVVLTLERIAPVAAAPAVVERPAGSRYGTWKWAAGGGAAALLVGGIVLVGMDGGTTDCAAMTQCKRVYATKGLGIGALIAGAALGGVAAYLFVNDRVETQVSASAGGFKVMAGLRF